MTGSGGKGGMQGYDRRAVERPRRVPWRGREQVWQWVAWPAVVGGTDEPPAWGPVVEVAAMGR